MITKMRQLKNIGKFFDCSAKDTCLDWHKNTFILASNAYGKSTLVHVLRSLQSNDSNLIRARKTLGSTTSSAAVVIIDGENYVFDGTQWNKSHSDIQVFDTSYIHDNILTNEICLDHKKNIYKIIIGEQGIKLAAEIAELKEKEGVQKDVKEALAKQFNDAKLDLPIEDFVALLPEEEAASQLRVKQLEADLKSKETEGIVSKLGYPEKVKLEIPDIPKVKLTANETLATAHEQAEKLVSAHIGKNIKEAAQAKQFIQQGLAQVQSDCPFCGQNLENAASLLQAYRNFFDEAFAAFQKRIALELAEINRWNIDNDLTKLLATYRENMSLTKAWAPFISVDALPPLGTTLEECRSRLLELKALAVLELEKKQKDPNSKSSSKPFDDLILKLAFIKTEIETYNVAILAFAEKAKRYVAELPKSDIAAIKTELSKAKNINKRFNYEWVQCCDEYVFAKTKEAELGSLKKTKQLELKDYSKKIFEDYQSRINALLPQLGADFLVTGLIGKTNDRAKESYSDFGFSILNKTVPISPVKEDGPCLKNTLSEGDKSTLAFAFFIASLEKQSELARQIVVLDDPLSSLDENRREATAAILAILAPRVRQLVVLTHKQNFIFMLCKKIKDRKTLWIRSDRAHGSRFENFDTYAEQKSKHMKVVDDLMRYMDEDFGPRPERMQGDIRVLFETVLKTKYYPWLAKDIEENKGLTKLLQTLVDDNMLTTALQTSILDVCSLASPEHHGDVIDSTPSNLTRDEVVLLIRRALDLVCKV